MEEKTLEQLIKEALEKSEIKFNEKLDELKASQYKLIADKHIDALIKELKEGGFID